MWNTPERYWKSISIVKSCSLALLVFVFVHIWICATFASHKTPFHFLEKEKSISIVKSCSLTCFSHSWANLYRALIVIVIVIITIIFFLLHFWFVFREFAGICICFCKYFLFHSYNICIFLVLYFLIRSYSESLPVDAAQHCNAVTECSTHSN